MKPQTIPDHLQRWWESQYKAVQEFGHVLLNEQSASPRLISFFEALACKYPKLRSVRMTNALHALWRQAPCALVFELALKHYKTPTEINEFCALVLRALPQVGDGAAFEAVFNADSPIGDVLGWLEARSR